MSFVKFIVVFLLSFSTSVFAADQWPSQTIRLIVPYAPGGATDVTGRLLAENLRGRLGQSVIVENRSGAGGNIGTDLVAKAAPDGYTMLFAYAGPIGINQFVYKNLPFNPKKDFSPVTLVAEAPLVLVVNSSLPVKTVDELIAYAKANPNKLSYGSSGTGGADHLAGELFKERTGTTMVHVPYKGGAPAMNDLVGGQTNLQFATIPGAIGHIRSGRIRPIALLSSKRFGLLPDVPTIAEAGLSDFEINNWYGIALPAGTPEPIVKRLNKELVEIVRLPEVGARFLELGLIPLWMTPEEFKTFLEADAKNWEKIVRTSGAAIE
ncbi:MAG: Bug family tripartite tricarboxylate transporter substrate binding protein [Burkholderiaceae bacterium]